MIGGSQGKIEVGEGKTDVVKRRGGQGERRGVVRLLAALIKRWKFYISRVRQRIS